MAEKFKRNPESSNGKETKPPAFEGLVKTIVPAAEKPIDGKEFLAEFIKNSSSDIASQPWLTGDTSDMAREEAADAARQARKIEGSKEHDYPTRYAAYLRYPLLAAGAQFAIGGRSYEATGLSFAQFKEAIDKSDLEKANYAAKLASKKPDENIRRTPASPEANPRPDDIIGRIANFFGFTRKK